MDLNFLTVPFISHCISVYGHSKATHAPNRCELLCVKEKWHASQVSSITKKKELHFHGTYVHNLYNYQCILYEVQYPFSYYGNKRPRGLNADALLQRSTWGQVTKLNGECFFLMEKESLRCYDCFSIELSWIMIS